MISPKKRLDQTDTELRELLEKLFASNDLYTREEIIRDISATLHFELDLLIYVREKSWFEEEVGYLTFSYLSFEYLEGKTKLFTNRSELQAREALVLQQGYKIEESRLCRILYRAETELDLKRVLNLIMRIMVAFYFNCGSHDHFRQSVSSRFIREFFRSRPTTDVSELLKYIEEKIKLKASLWKPRDAMYFSPKLDYPADQLLRPFHQESEDKSFLLKDENFARDLRSSVLRKNQTSGVFSTGDQYVINTFTTNRISAKGGKPWSSYKVRQQAVVIFESKKDERILLDAVFYACQVIDKYLEAFEDVRRADIFMEADQICFEQETCIAEAPISSVMSIYKTLSTVLTKTVDRLAEITQAEAIAVWFHDPFEDLLIPKYSKSYDDKFSEFETLSVSNIQKQNQLASRCFAEKKTLSLSHPDWCKITINNLDQLPASIRAIRRNKIEINQKKREEWQNSGGFQKCAALAVPIRRGKIVIGVVEIVSSEVGDLKIDSDLVAKFADICGNSLRRLELANDRAWLARMSFIHASRHKVENLLREVEKLGKVGTELVNVIRYGAEEFHSLKDEVKSRSVERIETSLLTVCSRNEVNSWKDAFLREIHKLDPKDISFECLADATETLVSNHSHSNFFIDSFKVVLDESDSNFPGHLKVLYDPNDVWIDGKKIPRIGVSPIPSKTSLTFHIGLFLLSAQIRMLGGYVQSKQKYDDIDTGLFGIAFRIPTNSRRGRNEI